MSPRLRNLLMTSTALLALGAALLALGAAPGGAQPTGGTVVGGTATISGTGTNAVIVNQATDRAIINWNTFNIATGGAATFNQPGTSSITLNRVTGGLGPSVIDGTLTANGRVFVINRDGMLFGRNAVINTAGFLASTNDIRNEDFMAGRNNFNIAGRADASIVNFGTITASNGGFAALVAPGVRNTGTISARLGTVALASGNSFTLDMYGDRLIQIAVGDEIASKVIDVATGKPLNALVSNEGRLSANGGRVEITAAAARAVVDSVINNSGVIEANSIGTRGGMIVLGGATASDKAADLPKQTVRVSGTLSATGADGGTRGGTIKITGEDIQFAAAMLDVSGQSGGGTILVGGDYGGGRPIPGGINNQSAVLDNAEIPTATTVTVDAASTFNASATANGHGGKVILWSDMQTTYAGTIFARGGEFGGNGGFVEVSGKQRLAFTGAVDTRAPQGQTGTLLLDPADFYIDLVDGPTRPPGASVMTNVQVQNLLATNDVTITTNNTSNPEGQSGNLTVYAPIVWSTGNSLTLSAYRNVNVSADITNTGGANVTLRADNTGTGTGTVHLGERRTISTTGAVSIFYNPLSYNDEGTRSDIFGNPYSSSVIGGANVTAYMLVNSFANLQNIATNLSGHYALGRNINADNMAPIGTAASPFAGTLEGNGHTISNAIITSDSYLQNHIGLFASIGAGGAVRNLTLSGFQVTANSGLDIPDPNQFVGIVAGTNAGTISNVTVTNGTVNGLDLAGVIAGGLVGQNGVLGSSNFSSHNHGQTILPGTITNSTSSATVTVGNGCAVDCFGGWNLAGGLVGANLATSTITASSASGAVTGGAYSFVGGLVGGNVGDVSNSSAAGAVSSTATGTQFSSAVGGLVGFNTGSIANSHATGNASGVGSVNNDYAAIVGGLVGLNNQPGQIVNSYATGNVSGTNQVQLGGLVGGNFATITNSYATGAVTGSGQGAVGGLVGLNVADASITGSRATGAVTGNGPVTGDNGLMVGGLVGDNSGTIANSHATGAVALSAAGATVAAAGGFVGINDGSIVDSYATGNVTASNATLALLGGFAGANSGEIRRSHATGNVTNDTPGAWAGGFVGFNAGQIDLSYATGNVTAGNNSVVGGFVSANVGRISQAYARGAVTGGANSYVGGFVGINAGLDVNTDLQTDLQTDVSSRVTNYGAITQSYAFGPVTGGNAVVAAGFAALNLGSFDQVYAVGRVQGGNGAVLGGLVGANALTAALPDLGPLQVSSAQSGTATNSYWDTQATGVTISAGGTGMTTAVLSGGLPPGFDPAIWAHGSYPYLVNLGTQNTNPLVPVNDSPQFVPPPDQQINANPLNGPQQTTDTLPDVPQFVQQQQQQQQQAQRAADQLTTGSTAPDPIRLDVGENRYFYLPPPTETRLVSDEVVLQMPCDVPTAVLDAIVKQHALSVLGSQCLQAGGTATFRMRHASSETVSAVIRALAQHQVIAAAQANYVYATQQEVQSATSQQGDPGQYAPAKLRLPAAHRMVRGAGILIGVIDSEIDPAHPDYTGAVASRYDATGVEDRPHPHGTGMAGAIVSRQRLLGVAPGARILAIRAFSSRASNAESTTYHILKGVDWAVSNNVRIINMSFAGPRDPSLERALKAAHDKGVVLIAAAGNAGPQAPALYPAADPNVIAVTATDIDDRLFTGANRGAHIAIAAPGVDIMVPAPAGEYQVTTGTSVATAHISGVVALMLERNPKLTPAEVRKILAASARRLGPANQFGAGLVNPVRAIEMATPRSATAPEPRARAVAAAAR